MNGKLSGVSMNWLIKWIEAHTIPFGYVPNPFTDADINQMCSELPDVLARYEVYRIEEDLELIAHQNELRLQRDSVVYESKFT